MLNDIVLNVILILFPLTCYIIYLGSAGEKKEKIKNGYLDLALFTSLFLYIKYGENISNYDIFILVNIPLLIAIIKHKRGTMFILSILIILAYYYFYKFNIIYLIIEYSLYYLLLIFSKDKKNIIGVVIAFTIIKVLVSILYVYKLNISGGLIFMFISFFALYLFSVGESIMDMTINIKKLKKEKLINDSIFKITHEIKNPIAVCKGYLDMFDPKNEEKSLRYVSILKDEIDHTLELLKDFLNFSKIEINSEEIDIGMLLNEVYNDFKGYVEANGIYINYSELEDDIYIEGDYKRLKQVFINIIKNSMEAIKEKNQKDGKIEISCSVRRGEVDISLEDNGVGIDSETLKVIYEPFYTTKQDGTGLGVCYSKEVIDNHNGSINYYTEFGKWTKVVISLPIKGSN